MVLRIKSCGSCGIDTSIQNFIYITNLSRFLNCTYGTKLRKTSHIIEQRVRDSWAAQIYGLVLDTFDLQQAPTLIYAHIPHSHTYLRFH